MTKLAVVLSTHAAAFAAVAFKGAFEENVAKIASWGYDGVELAVRDPRLVDGERIEGVVRGHGLAVPAIGTGPAWGEERLSFTSTDPAVRKAAVERIASHVPLAARLDALVILGLIRGVTPAGQARGRSMEYVAGAIRECTASAAGSRVRFALEPINRYETDLVNTAAEAMALVDEVGSDRVGLLLDTFHMNIEEPSIEESIRTCGDRIFHFHVADSNRRHPGAGHLDFASILRALEETGYEGYVSGEFMPLPDADTAASRGIAFLQKVVRAGVGVGRH